MKRLFYCILSNTLLLFVLFAFNLNVNSQIVITEIMYNPPESGTDSLEYIEIYNAGNSALDLNGYYLTFGGNTRYTFTSTTSFSAGTFIVFAVNESAVKRQFNLSFTPIKWNSGGLNNSPSTGTYPIKFYDNLNVVLDSVYYDDATPWPTSEVDGGGSSIVLCDVNDDNNIGSNWLASTLSTGKTINTFTLKGSPGYLESCSICKAPTALIITGNNTICNGDTLSLASTVSGTAPFTYSWSGAGTFTTPDTSSTKITGVTASNYTLTVTNTCGTVSATVTAIVNPLPTIVVSVNPSNAKVCAGNQVTLAASGASTYTWTNGVTNNIAFTPNTSATYTVTGTDGNGCSSSATTSITVNTFPDLTTTLNGITIISNETAATYQWINCTNKTVINGATSKNYSVNANGSYAVIVTKNTCSDTSGCVNVTSVGIASTATQSAFLEIFPNPNNGNFTLNTNKNELGIISILNMLGDIVYTENIKIPTATIQIDFLANGVYFIEATNNNLINRQKIVISK